MKSIFGSILAGCIGLALSLLLVPNVEIPGDTLQIVKIILIAGFILGLLNFFLKPIIKIITIPLRLLTLGLFGLVINMAMIWAVDVIFTPELTIKGIIPLFWTGILVWGSNFIFAERKLWSKKNKKNEF